jgi:carboxyl-terminal processing protease
MLTSNLKPDKMKSILSLFILILSLLVSCKKDHPDIITPAMGRDTLFYVMKEFYFWNNMPECVSVNDLNKVNYKDPFELLEAMRYKQLDRWSFVADYQDFMNEMQGEFVGHGIKLGLDSAGKARIAAIYDRSPLYLSGVRRGWIIEKVNNTDLAPILISGNNTEYTNLMGPSTAGVTNKFLFRRPDGTEITISSTKSVFTVNTVLLSEVLHLTSGQTGHLVFEAFINPTFDELVAAFTSFKGAGINDLILDMRYNTGGYLSIAQTLASYIAGNSRSNDVFARLTYNSMHQEANYIFPFLETNYSMDLSRIVIITSRSTASASEAVINGLKPFVNVVLIGDTTHGKPTGMNGWPVDEKYYLWPVTFEMRNANNQGNYYSGFAPDNIEPDDITRDFNDPEEACLKEAINYLQTGSFLTKGTREFKRYPVVSEKPTLINNTFVGPVPLK